MKSSIIVPFVFLTLKVCAQQPLPIVIDFKDKAVTGIPLKASELRKARQAYIKIDNLPSGQYKISINKKDSTLQVGNEPALFGLLSFGDGFSSLLGGLSAHAVTTVISSADRMTNTNGRGRGPASESFKSENKPKEKKKLDPCSLENYSNYAVKELQDSLRQRLFEFHFIFRDEIIKTSDRFLSSLELKPANASDTTVLRTTVLNIIERRLKLEKDLELLYKNYYDEILISERFSAIGQCNYLRAADSMLVNYKQKFSKFLDGFDTAFNEIRMAKLYNQLKAPKLDSYKSLPLSLKSDLTILSVDITGVDATKTPQSYSTTIELDRHPNQIWTFSTGMYLAGLRRNEFTLFAEVDNSDTSFHIGQSEGSRSEAGINAMMHIGSYFNNSSKLGWFGSFGPALSLENKPRPRILLGAGLIFGRTNKVLLGFGFIGGPVRTIANAYKVNQPYKISPAKDDILSDRFKSSWYISLGYGLFGK